MNCDPRNLQHSIDACIANARRLMESAEWTVDRRSVGLALALFAQEELAKAFLLKLVRDGILPWVEEVRLSLKDHCCKHLVTVIMEWLSEIEEARMKEGALPAIGAAATRSALPPQVATAMNIYRHEMVERIGRRNPQRNPGEWRGLARKIAEGDRERKKHAALYVSIGEDGGVISQFQLTEQNFEVELARAKAIQYAVEGLIWAYTEYHLFADLFREIFRDLATGEFVEEQIPSDIPGVVFVTRTVKVVDVIDSATPARPPE